VITVLPTSKRAVLLKLVEIIVSSATLSPAFAATNAEAPAFFNSTEPLISLINAF
jgi:hypothetical protein